MQSAFAAGDPQHKLAIVLADTITAASGGRLIIDIEQGGAIVPAGEEFDGVRTGALEIAFSANMYNKHLHSAAPLLSSISGGLSAIQRMFWYEFGGGLELAKELYAPHGITYIGYIALPGEDFAYTKEPLKTLEDVKKLKMRTAGDGGEIMSRLGAATVFMPGGELYESMQRGVINSFEYGAANEAWENGFHEVFNHVYLSTSRAPSDENSVVIGTETFNALSDDLKVLVEAVVLEAADDYYGPNIVKDAQALQNIIDYGVTVESLSKEIEDAFLVEAVKFYDEAMVKEDELYRRIMESQREFKEYCILKQLSG
jgi:TRAP-type mannitol/chloroaromatic compound transport system substrate-binding protein